MAQPEVSARYGVARAREVVAILRKECPWDADQDHQSLVRYLIEEAYELAEAIESGTAEQIVEELGDVFLQVLLHAQIRSESSAVDLDQVADRLADKLIERHPHVFEAVPNAQVGHDQISALEQNWERQKQRRLKRNSILDGIPQMSSLARPYKIIKRSHVLGRELSLSQDAITEREFSESMMQLLSRAASSGIDPEQILRAATRQLEDEIRNQELTDD